jgi:hypothetical protein
VEAPQSLSLFRFLKLNDMLTNEQKIEAYKYVLECLADDRNLKEYSGICWYLKK